MTRIHPVDVIAPCQPSPIQTPPTGADWLHEIKHDGFRILARRDAEGARLYSRNGHDFSKRFPQVVAAVAELPGRSCLIDGEAIVTDESGLAVVAHVRERLK
jgi:ATP-dependent DNA ligase